MVQSKHNLKSRHRLSQAVFMASIRPMTHLPNRLAKTTTFWKPQRGSVEFRELARGGGGRIFQKLMSEKAYWVLKECRRGAKVKTLEFLLSYTFLTIKIITFSLKTQEDGRWSSPPNNVPKLNPLLSIDTYAAFPSFQSFFHHFLFTAVHIPVIGHRCS